MSGASASDVWRFLSSPDTNDRTGWAGIWEGKVRYVKADFQAPQTGEASFSFDTTGGTQHITQSLATEHTYASARTNGERFRGHDRC